ncbi:uncharacterized protein TRAVEDRAFT_51698 [Trametes versicolor FP-101664 SS1]|uniref:uncharacterized protein n=1 Tax=Trametes versicolor (strain FP-101664) TaxID=717944 RepID=UPI000462498E|nr:uncharacterized protein TRAVEDRAFT_51698 [Trametes versicolor FP-101664 SS1]EIW53960.1 hypothetical protein TRAVEDRAFT_51698 [Trametes versicolor FP-101664 SS1]
MDSLDTNPQLTAEFVKFLNAQLQDCGDQLQRLNEENVSLRQTLQESAPQLGGISGPTDDQTISSLNVEIATLKDELAALQRTAEDHRKDAATWRERLSKGRARSETQRSVSPFDAHLFDEFVGEDTASSALRKRAREEEEEAGPSKVRRVDDLLNDGWF